MKKAKITSLQNDIDNIMDALATASEDVKLRAKAIFNEHLGEIKERTSELRDATSDYIAEEPFKAAGIATGVGIALGAIVGFMLSRK